MVSRSKIAQFEQAIADARAEVDAVRHGSPQWRAAYTKLTAAKDANRAYQQSTDFTVDEDAADAPTED